MTDLPSGTTESAAVPPWRRAAVTARGHGLVAALRELHAEVCPDVVPSGPGGHVVLPTALLERTGAVGTTPLATPDGDLGVGRPTLLRTASQDASWGASWDLGLAWLRLGQSQRLLDASLAYLRGRSVGGGQLLLQQLVKGSLADVVGDQLTAETLLDGAEPAELPDAVLAQAHDLLTDCDRALLRLLGASGYRADGPGACAYASALLADAYLRRPDREESFA
jgi:hypothetical protein